MARQRRRDLEEKFYDVFCSWSTDDQRTVLRVLAELHRQALKRPDHEFAEVMEAKEPNETTTRESGT